MAKSVKHSKDEKEWLLKRLNEAKKQVEIGGIYCHYKYPNEPYKAVDIRILESSLRLYAVYQRVNDNPPLPWLRSLKGKSGWLTPVKLPNGEKIPRFTKVS